MNTFFNKEFLLVKFPILFPIIYGLVLFNFPTFETLLIFLTILLLAEPHFGATWPFFINKTNSNHISENKISLVFIPIIILFSCLIGFFFFNKIFYLIFFAANVYHVTRQSFGISKLYSKDVLNTSFQEKNIYFFNLLFFLVAYLRFFLEIDISDIKIYLNLFVLIVLCFVIILYLYKFGFNQNIFTLITGCLIFYPACFVDNPVHVILMGVTMHFSQYLFLTNKVVIGRKNENSNNLLKTRYSMYFILIAVIYGSVMASLSMFGKYEEQVFKNLIIIPIIGQILHFYLDSQLWKFSLKHNRDSVLKYLSN
tara:strand:- start:16379 stop:17311 length:933 start_codon:yes stop_codon:yes gene_type:complete